MYGVFTKLLNMSLVAGIMVLVILVLRLVLKKAPRRIICVLWLLVALRLIFPFSISSSLSAFNLLDVDTDESGRIEYFHNNQSTEKPLVYFDVPALVNDNESPDSMTVGTHTSKVYLPAVTYVWLGGAALMLAYAVYSYALLRKEVSASIVLRDNIYVCDEVVSPFILGIVRPRIYLPSGMSDATQKSVLAHEMVHLKRRDHWWKPLGYVLLSVYWFNPLIWVAYILLCRDIETACDEKVVENMDKESVAAYSEALLACAVKRRVITACPVAFGETDVKGRVRNVLNYKKPAFWIIIAAVIACIVAAVCLLTNPKEDIALDTNNAEAPYGTDNIVHAMISEIGDGAMTVVPVEGSFELASADLFRVPIQNMDASPEPQVGDIVEIQYRGGIQETYPAAFDEIIHISVYERAEDHQFIKFTENPDGTYTAENGKTYKYLMTLTGRSPNAVCDSYFVVLSNDENLTFSTVNHNLLTSQFIPEGQLDYVMVSLGTVEDVSESTNDGPDAVAYTSFVAYANWTSDPRILAESLNPETMTSSAVPHLPVYRFTSRAEMDEFRKSFSGIFPFGQGYDEIPSFDDVASTFNDSFFADHTLLLTYVTASSCSFRYGVSGVTSHEGKLCLYVRQTNNPETYDTAMNGWFIMATVSNADIENCTKTDAVLELNSTEMLPSSQGESSGAAGQSGNVGSLGQAENPNSAGQFGNSGTAGAEDDSPWIWPCKSKTVSSLYGPATSGAGAEILNDHINIADEKGAPVYTAFSGVVEINEFESDKGVYIVIAHNPDANHAGEIKTEYWHLDDFYVKPGDVVSAGDCIGLVGTTGMANGPNLGFCVMVDGVTVDPLEFYD